MPIKFLKQLFSRDDSHEFKPDLLEIEEQPVNPLGPVTIWVIIFLLLFLSLWTCFGTMDIVVTARGMAIPDGNEKTIQYLSTGVIRRILVKEGERVTKDQVLVELDPSTVQPELESVSKTLATVELEMERIQALLLGCSFNPDRARYDTQLIRVQQDIYNALRAGLAAELSAKESELQKTNSVIIATKQEKTSAEKLSEQYKAKIQRLEPLVGIIPKENVENIMNQLTSVENDIVQAERNILQPQNTLSQLNQDKVRIQEEFKASLLQELSEKKKQVLQLEAQQQEKNFLSAKNSITSPVAGYVNKIMITTVGGVVTPAQPLLSIVPLDSPIMVKVSVLNKDIGFVKKDLSSAIKIDTFSFQKYGMLEGTVTHVANSSIKDEQLGPIYEVLITPRSPTLNVDGREEPLSAGMSVTAEIKVGTRRIIEFFIYPLVKYVSEGLSVQ